MSDNEIASPQSASNEDTPHDKAKDAPATDKPAAQPDEAPAEVGPAPKE